MKRLSKVELLELLISSERNNENLKKQLKEKTDLLNEKQLTIKNAGSLAEACLQLNDVVESAQAAADQYLENIKSFDFEQSGQEESLLQNARDEAEQILAEARRKCAEREAAAERRAEEAWDNLKKRLEDFYESREGLRELVAAANDIMGD